MHSDPLVIPVIIDNHPNSQFIRANAELLDQHSVLFNTLQSSLEKENLLVELWATDYDACLIKDSKKCVGIKFHNANSLSMFLLRWG